VIPRVFFVVKGKTVAGIFWKGADHVFSTSDLVTLAIMIVQAFASLLYSPLFLGIVVLVGLQYHKIQRQKEALFGIKDEPIWQHILAAVGSGLVGGLAGSFLMVAVGISLTDIGISWLWPLAIALMFISPRFLCFSYAGGLISLSFLIFGVPKVNVPQLMALVALLHMVEAILILVSGHVGAIPVYTRNKKGEVIGAFNLQKFWPIPIVALTTMVVPQSALAGTAINMPDWWPLIKGGGIGALENMTYVMLPVVAALGYGDLAATSRPQEKSRKSSRNLFAFSIILLGLAVLASVIKETAVLAALFSPLGHEAVIWLGQAGELNGKPLYVQPERGVLVLDILKDSPAKKLGLATGDIILNINGRETNSKYDLSSALEQSWGVVEAEWLEYRTKNFIRNTVRKPITEPFGTILAPGPYEQPMVEFGSAGLLTRWIKKIVKR